MSRKTSEAGDLVRAIIPVMTDIVPLFLEKWAELNDRPTLKNIEKQQDHQHDLVVRLESRVKTLTVAVIVLGLWSVALAAYILAKMH